MKSAFKAEKLTPRKGWLIFAVCWLATLAAVMVLRHVLIEKGEMDCYHRVLTLQRAVDRWNQAHSDKRMTDEIDEAALTKEGLWGGGDYDREKHYYFVGETAYGPRVKCNKHQDNPLVLRLTGVTLLAVLVFVVYCSSRKLVLFDAR